MQENQTNMTNQTKLSFTLYAIVINFNNDVSDLLLPLNEILQSKTTVCIKKWHP